jgi:hypothetical protein
MFPADENIPRPFNLLRCISYSLGIVSMNAFVDFDIEERCERLNCVIWPTFVAVYFA